MLLLTSTKELVHEMFWKPVLRKSQVTKVHKMVHLLKLAAGPRSYKRKRACNAGSPMLYDVRERKLQNDSGLHRFTTAKLPVPVL
jgi:hypothetical protein